MGDNRDSGARRALPGEGTGMSGVVELAEQLAVAVKALEEIRDLWLNPKPGQRQDVAFQEAVRIAGASLDALRGAA